MEILYGRQMLFLIWSDKNSFPFISMSSIIKWNLVILSISLILITRFKILLILVKVLYTISHIRSLPTETRKSWSNPINEITIHHELIIWVWIITVILCIDSPFRSHLPLQFLSFLKQSIHQHHQLIQNSIQVDTRGDVENVLIVHSNTGILIIDRRSGSIVFWWFPIIDLISDIPLASQKSYFFLFDMIVKIYDQFRSLGWCNKCVCRMIDSWLISS